jgi:major membrane immunogen (membrane-anchored lipoprotein)
MFILNILNYPIIDSNYYWHIKSISKDEIKLGDETIFPTFRGVNTSFSPSYDFSRFANLNFIIDIDNKAIKCIDKNNQKETEEINMLLRYFEKILSGLTLEDGEIKADSLAYADARDKSVIGIEIHSGRNRIVRRIFEHLGYDVKGLDRVMYANLTKKNVERSKWRYLSEKEIRLLKYMNASKKISNTMKKPKKKIMK